MKEVNNPELILISRIREAFSNQFEEELSNNKLSDFFGSRALINETLRKNRKFSERILFRIKKSIEENLTLDNREKALNALSEYMGEGGKKRNSNQSELDLIESLRDIISTYQEKPIDYTNLGRFFENQSLFHKAIKKETSFKSYIIDKIEWIIKQKLDEDLRIQALKVLEKYRVSKNYSIKPSTPIEELINSLQESFSNQNKKFITKSEISNLIGGKALLNYSVRNNSKLYQLTLIILEQYIKENLTGINKIKALKALKMYKLKIGYSVDSTEIEFIKVLANTFSEAFQRDIYLTELGELIASKSIINEALRKKTTFTKLTLDKIEKTIREKLKGENLNKALSALLNYKSMQGYIDENEAKKSTETKLAESIRRMFNSYYNEVLSYNKIGQLLGDRQLFSRIFYEKKVLRKDTINRLIENVKNVLVGESLNEVISLLNEYSQLRRYEKKIEIFNANSKLNEEICRCILEELFHPYKFPTVSIFTFEWLIGPNGGPMHIDGYNTELNLGFEFNGIQHYEIDGFLNKTKIELEKKQKADSHKEELINTYGKRVITIPYTVKLKDRINFIIEECRKLNVRVPEGVINISVKDIENRVREKIKNRAKEKRNKTHENSRNKPENTIQNMRTPYPYNRPRKKNLNDVDFSDPYLWFSPQIRKAIHSKTVSLIDQVHADVSVQENFSDRWEEVSNYDVSDLESSTTEEHIDNPDADIIPDQEIEPNPEVPENQERVEADDTDIITPDEEIEDSISEQQDLIEDQINDLENISEPEIREADLRPDDFDPVNEPPYDPISQPVTEIIPPPELPSVPDNVNTPQQNDGAEPQDSPQNQQDQEENPQVPEKSQDELGTEQSIEEIPIDSKTQDIDPIINEPIEPIQIPELGESGCEDSPDKTDSSPEDPEKTNQDEIKDPSDLDEKDEDTVGDKEDKKEIGDEEEDDKDDEQSKEDEEDQKEDEGESDKEPQEDPYDDIDDFEEEREHEFTPEDIYDIMREIYERMYPQIYSFQSSNFGSYPVGEIDFTDNFGENNNIPDVNRDCIDDFGQYRNENIPIDSFDELSEKFDEEDKFDNLM